MVGEILSERGIVMCLRERELILRGKEKRQGNRVRGELMHASRALKRSKRLENHPGRGAMPCDNIYIVARSAASCCSRACVRMVGQSENDSRHGNPCRTYAPTNDTPPKSKHHRAEPPTDNPRHRDTLTARRAGLASAAPRLPLAARHRKRGRNSILIII